MTYEMCVIDYCGCIIYQLYHTYSQKTCSCNSNSTTPAHDTWDAYYKHIFNRLYHAHTRITCSCNSNSTTPAHDTISSALGCILWIYCVPTLSWKYTKNMQLQQQQHHPSPRHHFERPRVHVIDVFLTLCHAHTWKHAVATATAVCCSVLQCIGQLVCCSVLQCVAVHIHGNMQLQQQQHHPSF